MARDARRWVKKGAFIRKEELRADGPQRFTVKAVLEEEKSWDGQPAVTELVLVSTEGKKQSLRTAENLNRMIRAFGHDLDTWPGSVIELYFSPDVRNPRGGEQGGIRIRVPGSTTNVDEYVSDLDEAPQPPAKGNGAEKPRVRSKSAGPVPRSTGAARQDEDIPF